MLDLRWISIDGLVSAFSEEIHFGERIGVIGPNGSGKTHLIRLLAGESVAHDGEVVVGPRVSAGLFTQLNARPDFARRRLLDIVVERLKAMEAAMRALARYGLADAANRSYETLSGGEKARLEILCLEAEGTTCCCSTSPPTTSTSIPPRRSSRRSTASRAPSSPCPTTARSCAAWTAFS